MGGESFSARRRQTFSTALDFVTFRSPDFSYGITMKSSTKLALLAICALSVSGCAFTGDVLQAAYDNKAEEDCRANYDPANNSGVSCKVQTDNSVSKWEKYRRESVLNKETED